MKKLVLSSEWKFHKVYQSWLTKYRVKKEFVTLVEVWARNTYNNTVFNYEIIKTDILDLKKINRDKLKENNSKTSLWINVETINID